MSRIAMLICLVLVAVLTAFQQRPQRFWGGGGWQPNPNREGLPTAHNGVVDRRFTFCRLLYQSIRREPMGHGWNTDYPGSDWNFLERFDELTAASHKLAEVMYQSTEAGAEAPGAPSGGGNDSDGDVIDAEFEDA